LYAPEVGFFNSEEVVLLDEIAMDIAFAIRAIEQENQRRQAETDLRESEARFRAMYENAGIGIVLVDEKGRPMESNLAFQATLGYTNEELRGMELSDLVHPDDREEERKLFHELITGKRLVYQLDKRYVRKDGRIIWGGVTVSVVRNDDGKPLYVIGMLRDITERRRAVELLARTEERFSKVFHASPIAIGIGRLSDGRFIDVNESFMRLMGFSREEVIGRTGVELDIWADTVARTQMMNKLKAERSVHSEEIVLKTKRNEHLDVHASFEIVDISGEPCMLGLLEDISERKRAEEALRENEKRYRSVVENLTQAYYEADRHAAFTYCNPGLVLICGYAAEELIGTVSLRLVAEEHRQDVKASYKRWVDEKRTDMSMEFLVQTKQGRKFWIEQITHYEFDSSGTFLKATNILRDIDERKRAEEELRNTEEKYRSMFDSAGEGIYQSTPDGKFVAVNLTFARILGYRDPEDLMTSITSIEQQLYGNPEDRARLKERLATEGFVGGFETELVRKDGTKIWVSENARSVKDGTGSVRYYEGFVQDITERKRADEELRAREFWLRESQRVGRVGSYDLDIRREQWTSSEILDEIFGIERDAEKSVATWNAIVHPDQREEMLQYFLQDVVAARRPFNKEYKIVRAKDGAVRWLWGRGELTYDEAGSPVRMIGVIQDITEKRRAEEQLQRSAIEYRNLFERANDAIIIFEPVDEIILEANGKACEIYGFSRQELVDLSLKKITKDVAKGEQQIQELLRGGDFHNFETVHLRKDGTPIDMLVSASVIEYMGRKAIQSINRDITDWKHAQEKLRQLSSAVEQSPVSIIITDTKGAIEYVNPRFTEVTGYTYAETIGKNPRILKSGNQTPEEYARLWATITAGKEWRGEFLNKKKNGELYWEFASLSPIKDESGAITHFLAVKEDITERKSLEQQFRQVQKLESIGTLAGGVAHDFNNILGIILGHSTLLRRVVDDPQRMEKSIGSIESAVHRGAGLVRQILTFARKTDVAFEQLNVNETISELQKMLEETFPKTIVLSVHFDHPLCIIEADRTQLHQTLLNLCVNARDAMPDGGTITIRTSQIPGEQIRRRFMQASKAVYACITVSDSGTGMDEATRQRVFEPFFTTKDKGKGTGLGLAVVFGIMQSHHGFIDLESEVGTGTTFRLYFPHPAASIQPSNGEATVLDAVAGGDETILLVEDEEMLRELARTLLETHGYKVILASDGDEAVRRYEESRDRIALVVSDIGLPKLSGDAVFHKLKATNPRVSVILASGYIEPGVRSALLREGVHEIVQKPYEPTDFLRKIRETLDRRAKK
ncbi:MAG TPA: PAS domain S-box protein, partial [Bacteroidota bacterium]|nr:PAS domain S-box protein [Bacteroidota bacterium]